ncbi:autotransporter assembly complex family protein [Caulobacter sp. S45]|uniref:autotransporter assembly complex protein TamA n=1 Tax=Caulobacter sp. S45 TaxID=1641861 RepID=UPI00131DE3B1|nr:BamA/TamA family outer membrane protein [Caulobacter sp. S45]
MGLALAAIAVLSLPVCAARAAARHPTPEPRAQVQGVADKTLRQAIERAVGDAPGEVANRIEARRRAAQAAVSATALLRTEGYYDSEVVPDIGEGEHPKGILKVTPGPRTILGESRIEWVGTPPVDATDVAVRAGLKLKPGGPARAVEVLSAEGRLVAILQQHGYADAKAASHDIVVDHADKTMRPTFRIAAGALVRMDGMQLTNKGGRTNRKFLLKLAPWKPREIYKPDHVAELERRLLDTGVYDSVTVALAPQPNADGLRPVVVSVADRTRHALSLGFGYSTTEGVLVDSTFSTFNILHRADTLTVFAKAQTIDSRIGVSESLPDWWSPGQTLKFGPDVFRDDTAAYSNLGGELVADLTQRYGKYSFFTKGLSLVASRIDDHEGGVNVATIRPLIAVSFDHTNNTLDPLQGFKFDARAEPTAGYEERVGAPAGMKDHQEALAYLKIQAQASTYLPLDVGEDTVFAARVHAGSIIGGEIPLVPAPDRFYAGGGGSVRGYAYQGVGPHYSDNTPQGGLSLIETSLELRRRISGPFGAVLFLDSGTVGSQATPTFTHIASGIGVGFRYDLGFAPIRIDFATPINKLSGASQNPLQVYLSVGQSF